MQADRSHVKVLGWQDVRFSLELLSFEYTGTHHMVWVWAGRTDRLQWGRISRDGCKVFFSLSKLISRVKDERDLVEQYFVSNKTQQGFWVGHELVTSQQVHRCPKAQRRVSSSEVTVLRDLCWLDHAWPGGYRSLCTTSLKLVRKGSWWDGEKSENYIIWRTVEGIWFI